MDKRQNQDFRSKQKEHMIESDRKHKRSTKKKLNYLHQSYKFHKNQIISKYKKNLEKLGAIKEQNLTSFTNENPFEFSKKKPKKSKLYIKL